MHLDSRKLHLLLKAVKFARVHAETQQEGEEFLSLCDELREELAQPVPGHDPEKARLYGMYNGTSAGNERDELETYPSWLERQLLTRLDVQDKYNELRKAGIEMRTMQRDYFARRDKSALARSKEAEKHFDLLTEQNLFS